MPKLCRQCLFVLFAINTQAAELVVGFPDFAPYNYINQQGQIAGSTVDIVRKATEQAGYQFRGKVLPVKRGLYNMIRGELDMLSCMGRANYAVLGDNVDYSDVVIGTLELNAYHLSSTAKLNQHKDLLGHGLIIRRGYNYGGFIEWINRHPFKPQQANNTEQGLRLLYAKRQDYFIEYRGAVEVVQKTLDTPGLSSSNISHAPHYLAFAKHHRGTALQRKIEAAVIKVLSNH